MVNTNSNTHQEVRIPAATKFVLDVARSLQAPKVQSTSESGHRDMERSTVSDQHVKEIKQRVLQCYEKLPTYHDDLEAFAIACKENDLKLAMFICQGNANRMLDNSRKPLTVACTIGSLEIVKWLLENGAVVDHIGYGPIRQIFGIQFYYKTSALIEACIEGHLEIVKLLMEHNADINLLSPQETALHIACGFGNLEVVKFLLEHNADANKCSVRTPLYCTVCSPLLKRSIRLEICNLLLQHNANVNLGKLPTKDGNPESPIEVACRRGNTELVKLLLQAGADIPEHIYGSKKLCVFTLRNMSHTYVHLLPELMSVRDPVWE